jgi:hypothetical protein
VFVSDRESDRVRELVKSGLTPWTEPGFDPADGFSVLRGSLSADLVLLDPFGDFLPQASERAPDIAAAARRVTVTLFAPNLDPRNRVGRLWSALVCREFPTALIGRCPPLRHSGVRGESRYQAEVLLIVPPGQLEEVQQELAPRLQRFCHHLGTVLGVNVAFAH